MSERLLVVGATSAIAQAVARLHAGRGARLFLMARNVPAMAACAADLQARGAEAVQSCAFDADDIGSHAAAVAQAFDAFGGFDAALVAYGTLPDQALCQTSVDAMLASFDTNARSTVALLTLLADRFEQQKAGAIGVISSPAGERGRSSNYVYGASKAAVSVFASGLRQRLHASGVRVVTVTPGFVDTPMTAAFRKGPLWARPEAVGRDIDRALRSGSGVLYTPWFWRWIMALIRLVPERLFARLKL